MRLLTVLIVLSFAASVHAELPPGAYNKLRIDAEEAVTIEVTSVKEALMGGDKSLTVEAKVLGVERSKSGLKKGDTVTIKYTIPAKPLIGPAPPPVLEKDSVYPAFLNKRGQDFEPAAHSWSFKMTPEAAPAK